jgi:hypothetical protein
LVISASLPSKSCASATASSSTDQEKRSAVKSGLMKRVISASATARVKRL